MIDNQSISGTRVTSNKMTDKATKNKLINQATGFKLWEYIVDIVD